MSSHENVQRTIKPVLFAILITARCFFHSPVEATETCRMTEFQRCLLDNKMPNATVITNEVIQLSCRAYEDLSACVDGTGCLALPHIRTLYQGVQGTFNVICRERRDEYLSHGTCLESNEVKQAETLCALQEGNRTNLQYDECEKKSRVLSCVVKCVDTCCGTEAGNLYGLLLTALFQPANGQDQCRLQSKLEVSAPLVCASTSVSDSTIATTLLPEVDPETTVSTGVDRASTPSPSGAKSLCNCRRLLVFVGLLLSGLNF